MPYRDGIPPVMLSASITLRKPATSGFAAKQ
jgi:hypothetical protein